MEICSLWLVWLCKAKEPNTRNMWLMLMRDYARFWKKLSLCTNYVLCNDSMECVMGHHTGKFSRCSFFFHKLKDDYTHKKFRVEVRDPPPLCALMV
jgi:hypothetical protein